MTSPDHTETLFEAGFVSIDEINGAMLVGFADRQFDTSQYLMLQRALDADDDDGVYLELTSQANATYGQVMSCVLGNGRIEFTVDDRTAQDLGTETTFAVAFAPDEALSRRLEGGLARIFFRTGCQVTTDWG